MKITLIRHTSVAVENGICYGWTDVDVAPSFKAEASQVKQNLNTVHLMQSFAALCFVAGN